MRFSLPKQKENISTLMRKLLYSPQGQDEKTGELIFSRFLGAHDYPRFHLYIKETSNELIFDLHLDQKKPSYPGTKAHSGEYDGNIIEREMERIKQAIASNDQISKT